MSLRKIFRMANGLLGFILVCCCKVIKKNNNIPEG